MLSVGSSTYCIKSAREDDGTWASSTVLSQRMSRLLLMLVESGSGARHIGAAAHSELQQVHPAQYPATVPCSTAGMLADSGVAVRARRSCLRARVGRSTTRASYGCTAASPRAPEADLTPRGRATHTPPYSNTSVIPARVRSVRRTRISAHAHNPYVHGLWSRLITVISDRVLRDTLRSELRLARSGTFRG
eukprot:5410456-Prymnesium_polylepis.1